VITCNIIGTTNISKLKGTYGVFHFGYYANRDSPLIKFTIYRYFTQISMLKIIGYRFRVHTAASVPQYSKF